MHSYQTMKQSAHQCTELNVGFNELKTMFIMLEYCKVFTRYFALSSEPSILSCNDLFTIWSWNEIWKTTKCMLVRTCWIHMKLKMTMSWNQYNTPWSDNMQIPHQRKSFWHSFYQENYFLKFWFQFQHVGQYIL